MSALLLSLVSLLLACASEPQVGSLVEGEWVMDASEVVSPLHIGCAEATAGEGPFQVLIDNHSGWTILVEAGAGRIWLRNPFGLIPDRCWWLTAGDNPEGLVDSDCITSGLQNGQCVASEPVGGSHLFEAPGVAHASGPILGATVLHGTLLVTTACGVERLDMTPSAHQPLDPSEGRRTWLRWLSDIQPEDFDPGTTKLAVGARQIVAWDQAGGQLWAYNDDTALTTMTDPRHARAPRGGGYLDAAGPWAAIASRGEVNVYMLQGQLSLERRTHPRLRGEVRGVSVSPADGTVWVLVDGGVLELNAESEGLFYPAPGAEGLFVGESGGEVRAYAWGNNEAGGLLYRFQDSVGISQSVGDTLLGAGIGKTWQEIVLVHGGPDAPVVRSVLDLQHVESMPEGTVSLALAAFVESPNDSVLNDENGARAGAPSCEGEGLDLLCCAQGARGERVERQLSWLERRVEERGMAVVLGVNPTAIAQSTICDLSESESDREAGALLPLAIGDTLLNSQGGWSTALLFHSSPYQKSSAWVRCPGEFTEDWDPACWDVHRSNQDLQTFYDELAMAASLSPWTGEEPDWAFIGGGYQGSFVDSLAGWPSIYPSTVLPDGDVSDALYFGGANMNPIVSFVASKEIAPIDMATRALPVTVSHSSIRWAQSFDDTGVTYHGGQTFALPWLYESRQSGLMFMDWTSEVHPGADWSTDLFEGEEDPERMNRADFAVLEHYLVTRVLAHRNIDTPRWTYAHLQDLSRLQELELGTGWVDCISDCETDTELDRFLDRLERLSPALTWSASPL